MEGSPPLHLCHVNKLSIIINRSHALLHSIAIAFLIYYRASFLFKETQNGSSIPITPWLLVFVSELLLSFLWFLGLAYWWRPVSHRTVFPERLPNDDKLPSIDVFICTADPDKEPTEGVMNTVLSAMALDYPPEKLHVYLSDDGGSSITLRGMREAWSFAKWWLQFCRKYSIKIRCPQAYFMGKEDDDSHGDLGRTEFMKERQRIKEKYEMLKEGIMRARNDAKSMETNVHNPRDHPSIIEVIGKHSQDGLQEEQSVNMPTLVYVAREKRPSHPHHFKAGALNVLLRVSAVMSNSPYVLVLDCDMYCNDPTSARKAVCFYLDPEMSPSLGFVLFPQLFHNISKYDIYDSETRSIFEMQWRGLDGLEGPALSGTNVYISREALCSSSSIQKGLDFKELKTSFGSSNEFINSLRREYKPNLIKNRGFEFSSANMLQQETKFLASRSYEDHTEWGEKVGFMYHSVVEDYFTGFTLHCKGWKSVYLYPERPQFLGTSTTNLSDSLIQGTRWGSGLTEVALSRFCPLIYGPPKMSLLQRMGYAELAFFPLIYCLSLLPLATIPQLCLLHGIPLYPQVSDAYFGIFSFIFMSSVCRQLLEVVQFGRPIRTWTNEQRIWMIKAVTCHFYGSLDAILKQLGLKQASFLPTNKVTDYEQSKRYELGIFDFQASTMFLAPLATLAIVNVASLAGGVIRIIVLGVWSKMAGQVLISVYILVINYAIIEGMIVRKDKGRISSSVTLLSAGLAVIFMAVGSVFVVV